MKLKLRKELNVDGLSLGEPMNSLEESEWKFDLESQIPKAFRGDSLVLFDSGKISSVFGRSLFCGNQLLIAHGDSEDKVRELLEVEELNPIVEVDTNQGFCDFPMFGIGFRILEEKVTMVGLYPPRRTRSTIP